MLLLRCFTRSLRLVFTPIGLDQLVMGIGSGGKSKCDNYDHNDGDGDDCDTKVIIDGDDDY